MGIEQLSPAHIMAMSALCDFEEAMREGKLSTNDLTDIISLAIEDGHDMFVISLAMAIHAMQEAKDRTAKGISDGIR